MIEPVDSWLLFLIVAMVAVGLAFARGFEGEFQRV